MSHNHQPARIDPSRGRPGQSAGGSTAVLGEGQTPGAACCALRRALSWAQARGRRLPVDRRAAAHQRPRHLHHHQRLDDAAGGARGDGRGGAGSTCTSTSWRKPSARGWRDAHRRRVGPRHERLLGRADARHGGLRGRRQPGSARPAPEPERLPEGRSHHPDALAQRLRRRDPRRRRAGRRSLDDRRSSRRRSVREPPLIYILAGPKADESPLERARPWRRWRRRRACRFSSMRRPRSSPFRTCTCRTARRSSPTAAASACAGRRPAACCSAARIWCSAAWVHSAPHHGLTRSLKVGKEEAIGMLMAVEMWVKRDHDAEWKRWTAWLDHIAQRVCHRSRASRPSISQPNGLSNRTPSLRILWDRQKLGLTGEPSSARSSTANRAYARRRARRAAAPS